MKKLQKLLIILSILTSCGDVEYNTYVADYENVRRSTIEAWEEKISSVSNECYNRSKEYVVSEVDTFPDENCIADFLAGCVLHGTKMVFILSSLDEYTKADVAVHEYVHVLAYCELGDGDKDHLDIRLWNNADSVEIWGQAGLNY